MTRSLAEGTQAVAPATAGKPKGKAIPAKPADSARGGDVRRQPRRPTRRRRQRDGGEGRSTADAERATLTEMRAELAADRGQEPRLGRRSTRSPTSYRASPGRSICPSTSAATRPRRARLAPQGASSKMLSNTGRRAGQVLASSAAASTWRTPSPTAKNPLTARVIVNRVWQQHFGRGHGRTPRANFGASSATGRPTPNCSTTLAVRFMEDGWSREVAAPRRSCGRPSYQASSEPGRRRRHDATDAANRLPLAGEPAAGSTHRGVAGLGPAGRRRQPRPRDGRSRRSTSTATPPPPAAPIYAKISRHDLNGFLRLFDFPDANVTAARSRNEHNCAATAALRS